MVSSFDYPYNFSKESTINNCIPIQPDSRNLSKNSPCKPMSHGYQQISLIRNDEKISKERLHQSEVFAK